MNLLAKLLGENEDLPAGASPVAPVPPQPEGVGAIGGVSLGKESSAAGFGGYAPGECGCPEQDPTEATNRAIEATAPPMPMGVRLIRWALQAPPIALDVCSVVTEPERFAKSELALLRAKLQNPRSWTGWTVAQHIDRLRQVGVIVEVDR